MVVRLTRMQGLSSGTKMLLSRSKVSTSCEDCWVSSKGTWQGRKICWHREELSNILHDTCWHI
eukprot:4765461-Prorocentrum_lima.AAC.1